MLRHLAIICCVATLGFALQPVPSFAQSAEAPAVGILIDSSRAMASKLNGASKTALVGNALATNFVKYDGKLNMSLAVFGHEKREGCSAVDVVQDLEPLRATTFARALVNLKTVGVAPLALALETMATSLVEDDNARDLIVITTSRDSCKRDPCKIAAKIKRRQPDLRINIIGIDDPNSGTLNTLRCVADQTGGSFMVLADETDLTNAIDQTINTALSGRRTAILPDVNTPDTGLVQPKENESTSGWSIEPEEQATKPEPEAPTIPGQGTIRLVALLTDGQKPIPAGLTWRVFATKKAADGTHPLLSEQRDWAPVLQLPAGEYLVNAAYGRAHLTRKIRVTEGAPRVEQFVLQAGGLRLRAVDTQNRPVRSNVTYSVLSGDRDQYGNRRTIIANVRPGLIVRLNAGIYNVISRYGDANAIVQTDVTVEPGKLTQIAMTHIAGTATFKLVSRPGGEAIAGTQWSIRTPDGTEIKRSQGALPSHILAPGTYRVFATLGGRTFGGQFLIDANENKQIEIVIK